MRTSLILPEQLIDQARETLGFTSKTDTVVHALREVVRRGKRDDLMAMIGRIGFNADAATLRGKARRRT
jgi:Arc/MetJ family transcription regulator